MKRPLITIAQKLAPFSHRPGTICLIPGTDHLVEAFPGCVRILNWERRVVHEERLAIEGPLRRFTLIQDLERGCVTLSSEAYRLHILPDLRCLHQKHPGTPPTENRERLSFGSHKKQEWEKIEARRDLRELFPILFRLGSLLTLPSTSETFPLLEACRHTRPEAIASAFEALFLVHFGEMVVPRATDTQFQGILSDTTPIPSPSPLYLLAQTAAWIRSLFIRIEGERLALLPALPPECFAGRLINVSCAPWGSLDLEWTKKSLRQVVFRSAYEGSILFQFQSHLKEFRLREQTEKRGRIYSCGEPLEIKRDTFYLLDRFQK